MQIWKIALKFILKNFRVIGIISLYLTLSLSLSIFFSHSSSFLSLSLYLPFFLPQSIFLFLLHFFSLYSLFYSLYRSQHPSPSFLETFFLYLSILPLLTILPPSVLSYLLFILPLPFSINFPFFSVSLLNTTKQR